MPLSCKWSSEVTHASVMAVEGVTALTSFDAALWTAPKGGANVFRVTAILAAFKRWVDGICHLGWITLPDAIDYGLVGTNVPTLI